MKIKKGDKIYPIITGDDVIITKGVKHPGQTVDEAFNEVDNTLDEHKKDIDKLKSNMKYLYSYGGVGGNGRGGSGGSQSGTPALFISLNGRQVQSGSDNVIVLNSPGQYVLEGSVSNNGGDTYYVDVKYGPTLNRTLSFILNADNRWKISPIGISLINNGSIQITFSNSDSQLSQISQNYVVNPHTFETKFKYEFNNGEEKQENEFDQYEYFIGNSSQTNPFINVSFKISIPNATNVTIKYDIGDTDGNEYYEYSSSLDITAGHGTISYGSNTDISNNPLKIYLDKLVRNNEKFTDEVNNGTYNVSVTLTYTINGNEQKESTSFDITFIPNNLYIHVKNSQNLIYDTLADIEDAIRNGRNGIPEKYVNIGTYTSFTCKVFEGPMVDDPNNYYLEFNVYDYVSTDSDDIPDIFEINEDMSTFKSDVKEQIETTPPFSMAFQTKGIKRLEFRTTGKSSEISSTIKYIFVNEPEHIIKSWYPENNFEQTNFYFRANLGTNINSEYLRGLHPFEMSEKDRPKTINDSWSESDTSKATTILSFGIQYSAVNKTGNKILEAYSSGNSTTPAITLYSDKLFDVNTGGATTRKICIPSESNYNKSINEQYHLVQIVRHKIGNSVWGSYLYIDGILESSRTQTDGNLLRISKIVFNNVNAVYNLIDLQYVKLNVPNQSNRNLTIDELIFQYYLAYKDIMNVGTVSEEEQIIYNNMSSIRFDGTNVIVNYDLLRSISPKMSIPTMMMEYVPKQNDDGTYNDEDIQYMIRDLFRGYGTASTVFEPKKINLYWCNGSSTQSDLEQILIPSITDDSITYTGSWMVGLQGTSTMRNRIKNFSLILSTENVGGDKKLLMSPNYDSNDSTTFLPEDIWTLKADIADSAHANNTSVGKFVNRVCTKFSSSNGFGGNGVDGVQEILPYIKNTLEGFPILMYFKIGNDVYYLGVYNFNMGRNSYYNLGYYLAEDTVSMVRNIQSSGQDHSTFKYSLGSADIPETLAIGEIQDNHPEYDFHQYQENILFGRSGSMFGLDEKITGKGEYKESAKGTLSRFVKSVARAGAYCFATMGKTPIPGKKDVEFGDDTSSLDCINRYSYSSEIDGNGNTIFKEYVPDISWQFSFEDGVNKWYNPEDPNIPVSIKQNLITFNDVKGDVNNLLQCISDTNAQDEPQDYYLDFTSAAEYYTICMAFGLVDSVLKNMNIKSWDGNKCYIAFYDMDCALGENNQGGEDVTYLAASDYWYSSNDNGYVEPVKIHYDYWDDNSILGKGFDYPSSYLFAVAKYAQAMAGKTLTRYPQQFWAELRANDSDPENPAKAALKNADVFIDKYFSSGIGKIPTYLASLNYQVKYLYYGKVTDADGNESTESRYLANASAFNGSRLEKAREWLRNRLHFLDFMFNLQGSPISIGGGYTMPLANPSSRDNAKLNPDVIILSDAFTSTTQNSAIMKLDSQQVQVEAPLNTPFIIARGSKEPQMFLLTAGPGQYNNIGITTTKTESIKFYGSKEFINVDKIEALLTSYNSIESDHIEEIKYGGLGFPISTSGLTVISSSVKYIKLDIPTLSGELVIDTSGELNGQALTKLDVSGSGLIGNWTNLKSLKEINISSVNSEGGDIYIAECPITGGNDCIISGKDSDNLTTLRTLTMSGISGDYKLNNTAIEKISFTTIKGTDATFEIKGDVRLKELRLTGFKSVKITDCPNLEKLYIEEHPDTPSCESIIIDIPEYTKPDGTAQDYLTMFNSETDVNGIFDFTKYTKLKTLGLSGCKPVVVIKIPNHKVSIVTFRENKNLEFIDTTGYNSCIELTQEGTFYNCPCYGMRQSWSADTTDNEKYITDVEGTDKMKYTHMCIRPKISADDETYCKTLAQTFSIPNGGESKYLTKTKYTNEWGQQVNNKKIDMAAATWFINTVVGTVILDDAYIGDSTYIGDGTNIGGIPNEMGKIYDTINGHDYGDDCTANIESLQGCFYNQKGIFYNGGNFTVPDLSDYKSLTNISTMYKGTDVNFISSALLSLPPELNTNTEHTIKWDEFVGNSFEINVSEDAFKNVSYRITGLTSWIFTIYSSNPNNISTPLETAEDNMFKIERMLCPKNTNGESYYVLENDEWITNGEFVPFNRLEAFQSFSINSSQWIDYTRLFEFCPNVKILNGFLNTDLSKANISGILKPNGGTVKLNNLESIQESFNHTGNIDSLTSIDLYEFFDWENEAIYDKIYYLFTSSQRDSIGFSIKKHISNENFRTIIGLLHNYKNIHSLMNLFSYCTIEDYDGFEIKLEDDMNDVSNINALFFKCKSSNDRPLKIRRSFFEHLKNVVNMANTFYGVYFDHIPSYDFFCKYTTVVPQNPNVKVKVKGVIPTSNNAYLTTISYGSNLIADMSNCFCDAKFIGCRCWFDINDIVDDENHTNEYYKPSSEVVTYNGDNTYTTYYKRENGIDVEYKVTNYALTDTINNFTNYVDINYLQQSTSTDSIIGINNHDINVDLREFNNNEESPFNRELISDMGFSPTYCCLPPDIFYACKLDCSLKNVFANTNIIGILPQHLLKNCYNGNLNNMFKNTNILPNLLYHYDIQCNQEFINNLNDETLKQNCINKRQEYLDIITEKDSSGNYIIPIDEDTINIKQDVTDIDYTLVGDIPTDLDSSDAIVLFRNSNGELRRRRPIATGTEDPNGEYSKSIFVYVPQGYSQNLSLDEAFTFRYNLPKQVNLRRNVLINDYGITWPAGNNFNSDYSPENKPWLWPHYTQYFFMVNESILWERVQSMISPFISDNQDISFETGNNRVFSTSNPRYDNVWWYNSYVYVNKGLWHSYTNGIMNIFLNLCGNRDIRTGMITDNGCYTPNINIRLTSFISGSLVAFLNGRIFDSSFNAGKFTSNGSPIVNYDIGVSRNIIFPQLYAINGSITNVQKTFISFGTSDTTLFYPFMFPQNLDNYRRLYEIDPMLQEGSKYKLD